MTKSGSAWRAVLGLALLAPLSLAVLASGSWAGARDGEMFQSPVWRMAFPVAGRVELEPASQSEKKGVAKTRCSCEALDYFNGASWYYAGMPCPSSDKIFYQYLYSYDLLDRVANGVFAPQADFVMFLNEPDHPGEWEWGQFPDMETMVDTAAAAVKRYPEIHWIGPCITGSSEMDWLDQFYWTWKVKYGEVPIWSACAHCYGTAAVCRERVLEVLATVETYDIERIMVTESGMLPGRQYSFDECWAQNKAFYRWLEGEDRVVGYAYWPCGALYGADCGVPGDPLTWPPLAYPYCGDTADWRLTMAGKEYRRIP